MSTTLPTIESHDLRRNFKYNEAVAGICFEVQPGEIFGLLGPNGAGKTTTIHLLIGQIDPSSRRAAGAGCDVVKDHQRLKHLIGVAFEEHNLYERFSAINNLRFGCWLYGLPEVRIRQVLELVGLMDRAKDPLLQRDGTVVDILVGKLLVA
jgi:ABC-2 type transport system ATP-binding protein